MEQFICWYCRHGNHDMCVNGDEFAHERRPCRCVPCYTEALEWAKNTPCNSEQLTPTGRPIIKFSPTQQGEKPLLSFRKLVHKIAGEPANHHYETLELLARSATVASTPMKDLRLVEDYVTTSDGRRLLTWRFATLAELTAKPEPAPDDKADEPVKVVPRREFL